MIGHTDNQQDSPELLEQYGDMYEAAGRRNERRRPLLRITGVMSEGQDIVGVLLSGCAFFAFVMGPGPLGSLSPSNAVLALIVSIVIILIAIERLASCHKAMSGRDAAFSNAVTPQAIKDALDVPVLVSTARIRPMIGVKSETMLDTATGVFQWQCELSSPIPFLTSIYGDQGPSRTCTLVREITLATLDDAPKCPSSMAAGMVLVKLFEPIREEGSVMWDFLLPDNDQTGYICELLDAACRAILTDIIRQKLSKAEESELIQGPLVREEDLLPYFVKNEEGKSAELCSIFADIEDRLSQLPGSEIMRLLSTASCDGTRG